MGTQDVLKYCKKAENQTRGSDDYHAVGGYLNVTDLRYINPLTSIFVQAALEAGLPLNNDFNAFVREGVGILQVTQKNGRRHSAATAYLKSIIHRKNLTIQTNCQVTRIIIEQKKAIRLTYIQNGVTKEIKVSKEIILCGGAINSPQLFMLSGIGDRSYNTRIFPSCPRIYWWHN
ncbi:hypothetical protein NIES2101_35950 [Calothrix sp. HK-06]|nr:hypothetical protein NIES2101_35950 [Calothrix sp. HK-06]